jgi:photosystem II stability/assembly factor-like uncharacterized protein
MSVHLESETQTGFLKKMPWQALAEGLLIAALVGFMVSYFWMSYMGEQTMIPIHEKTLSPHSDFFGIHRSTGNQCWTVGKFGSILHSKDGALNWEKQTSGTGETLLGVSFVDDKLGFAVGSGGVILSTRDGGLSWTAQKACEEQLLGVQAFDEKNIHAVGEFGTFLSSADGGRSWNKYEFQWEKLIPRIFEEAVTPNLNSVHFITPKTGWIVGECGLILYTKDGGQTWTVQRSGRQLPQLCAVIFRGERKGWAIGQKGTLLHTEDGGQHWSESDLGIDRDLYAAALDGEDLVLVGDRLFLKTENDGSTWTRRDFEKNVVLTGVTVASKKVTAVGLGGVLKQL